MKQVILENPPTVRVQDVNSSKYYGVHFKHNPKAFIYREKYQEGIFRILSTDSMTKGNHHDHELFRVTSLATLVKNAISENAEVFEFESKTELFSWLLQ